MGRHTESGFKPTPAIVAPMTPKHADVDVISTTTDTVTFRRGWGDSGYKVQTVEYECPDCSFDRMARRIDVSPELRNEVRYWCLNPNCGHYLRGHMSHAFKGSYPHRYPDEPAEFTEPETEHIAGP